GDNLAVLHSYTDAGSVTVCFVLLLNDLVVLLHPVVPSVNVNVTLPADTPVITPALVTVAMAVLLLVHVPPLVGDSVAVLPTHTDAGAVTVGSALTVTDKVVLLHPVVVSVNVTVTDPVETSVTITIFVSLA